MSYLVEIDDGVCAAHGDCAEIAPDVFALDDVVRVIGHGSDELLLAAAEACPTVAIRLVDSATGEPIYP